MTSFERVELKCPCCANEFQSQLVLSYSVGEKESDFCPRYLGANPLPNFLHVCEDCGFVGFEADYRRFADTEDESSVEKIRKCLRGLQWEKGQILTGANRYRRAALIAIYAGKTSAEIADLYLQATWCARMDGEDDDGQRQPRKKAVKYFELALASDEFAPDDLPVVHYLMGELNRRLGDEDKARTHFEKLDELSQTEDWLLEWRDRQRRSLG